MSSKAAKAMNQRQRDADREHHLDRLQWLATESPRYACGSPVPPSEAAQMTMASRQALELIDLHGMSLNHARMKP